MRIFSSKLLDHPGVLQHEPYLHPATGFPKQPELIQQPEMVLTLYKGPPTLQQAMYVLFPTASCHQQLQGVFCHSCTMQEIKQRIHFKYMLE